MEWNFVSARLAPAHRKFMIMERSILQQQDTDQEGESASKAFGID